MREFTATIDKVGSLKLQAGDIVWVENGTANNLSLTLNFSGTFANRITIKARNPGQVVLTGQAKINITGQYITLANLVFKNGGVQNGINIKGTGNRITGCDFAFNSSDAPIVSLYAKNNRLDHCIFHDFTKAGVWVEVKRTSATDYVLIDHNIFRNRNPGSGNGFETIRIGTSGNSLSNSRTTIWNNLFEKCNGELETISNKSCENIIYANTITSTQGTITLRHGNRSIVANNKMLQNSISGTGGIRVYGEEQVVYNNLVKQVNGGDTTKTGISIGNGVKGAPLNGYAQAKNININQNYLINNKCDLTIGLSKDGGTLKPSGKFQNNIVYKTTKDPVFSSKGTGSTLQYVNNKYYATNYGKNPSDAGKLSKPSEFDINSVDESKFGATEAVGLDWTNTPESSELGVEVNIFYDRLKSQILGEIGGMGGISGNKSKSFEKVENKLEIEEDKEHKNRDSDVEDNEIVEIVENEITLSKMTVKDLRVLAKERKLKKYSKLLKKDLIHLILNK